MCNLIDGETRGTFDPVFGNYLFHSTDMVKYPNGQYEFKITGTVGNKSDFVTFSMQLSDPCPTAVMQLGKKPIVVNDGDIEYVLRDP